MAEEKKIDRCRFSHYHLQNEFHCTQEGWEDDKVKKVDEAQCEACQKFKSRYIEYPITVNKLETNPIKYEDSWNAKIGQLVAVRPCGDEYKKKTYVGFYLGDLPWTISHSYNEESGVLKATPITNPAMFVPELGKIIWGMGSWWHTIKSEDQLKEITDEDIDGVWYVQLAKELAAKTRKEADNVEDNVPNKKETIWKQ